MLKWFKRCSLNSANSFTTTSRWRFIKQYHKKQVIIFRHTIITGHGVVVLCRIMNKQSRMICFLFCCLLQSIYKQTCNEISLNYWLVVGAIYICPCLFDFGLIKMTHNHMERTEWKEREFIHLKFIWSVTCMVPSHQNLNSFWIDTITRSLWMKWNASSQYVIKKIE